MALSAMQTARGCGGGSGWGGERERGEGVTSLAWYVSFEPQEAARWWLTP